MLPDLTFLNFYLKKIKRNVEWIIDNQMKEYMKKDCSVINKKI